LVEDVREKVPVAVGRPITFEKTISLTPAGTIDVGIEVFSSKEESRRTKLAPLNTSIPPTPT
jgi:acyl-CoA hydrolase